jgi:hypothetical protein
LTADEVVGQFVLEKEHRVIVADRRLQQSLGVVGRGGNGNLQAGHVEKESFGALRVVQITVYTTAVGHPNYQGDGALSVAAI